MGNPITALYRHAKSSGATKVWGVEITNYGVVEAGAIYRGAYPSPSAVEGMALGGVKSILCLLDASNAKQAEMAVREREACERVGIRFIWHSYSDRRAPGLADVKRTASVLADARWQPIFVHCVGGRHRTGGIVAAYRMDFDNMRKASAFAEAERFGYYDFGGHTPWGDMIRNYPSS